MTGDYTSSASQLYPHSSLPNQTRKHNISLDRLPLHIVSQVAFYVLVDDAGNAGHPAGLLPLLFSCKRVYQALYIKHNVSLYDELYKATFDYQALLRRYAWHRGNALRKEAGRAHDIFQDSRLWAADYKDRWEMSRRLRMATGADTLEIPGPSDGKNMLFLVHHCHLKGALELMYRDIVLPETARPGFPVETGAKGIMAWLLVLSHFDSFKEDDQEEVDQKMFILRPYSVAAGIYYSSYAPYTVKKLPLQDYPSEAQAFAVVPHKDYTSTYHRFNTTWSRQPPQCILACEIGFFRLLERRSCQTSTGKCFTKEDSSSFEKGFPGILTTPDASTLTSEAYDREWKRQASCQDPMNSPGLPPLTFKGCIEGTWRGKSLYMDFDTYRRILGGDIRLAFAGPYQSQAVEFVLREGLIKVRKGMVGGYGHVFHAGMINGDSLERELEWVANGCGHEFVSEDTIDEEGWTKEIIITGHGRTAWGVASIRGRVRSWDGLVLLSLSYAQDPGARWLWTGYVVPGGYLAGRWRDTVIPANQAGYEGAFVCIREDAMPRA
ncbi:hypothetical protein B9479_002303 [Cryptococcus floricola]|uniref:F-box domain-containing protein n=1 Tax=Cryptococcus floricola TaxID=2591691 RepID=A0A5D3B2Q3_9TREE|nr:hypothetical protein B9479_002303 [Cryptococcus floricola]